jgi:ABC-type uncharacterized transport system permease subunit
VKTLRLIALAVRYHWDAQKSNPMNLFAAVFGMILNNAIVLWGLWAMLFDGKPDARELTVYFVALNGMLTIAWGSVCFFLGGLHSLGHYVDEGALEPMLSTPRHPLVMAGISDSMAPALGDMIQGFLNIAVLFWIATPAETVRCLLFTGICATAVVGLFILTGSVPFFVKRGNNLALLLREVCLSMSFYPMGKVFTTSGRFLLYITPAAVTGFLPITAIESGSLSDALIAVAAAGVFLILAINVFTIGLRRYQTASYVTAR